MRLKTKLAAVAMAWSLLGVSAFAVPEGWTDDFTAAKADAAASGKDLLMDFTGSDWCGWCIRLREEVFDTEAFKAAAPDNFVFVELDFPNSVPQTDKVKAQNAALSQKFGVQGYPTIILADAAGRPYAQTVYQAGGAEAYLAHLDGLQAIRVARDEAFAAAESAEGVEKAKALDAALNVVGLELAGAHYGETVVEIIALDPDNAAGLKDKYEQIYREAQVEADMQEAFGLLEAGNYAAGLARLDQVIEDHEPADEQLQMITAIKGQVYVQMGDMEKAIQSLQEAIAVMPDSEIAPQIQEFIGQLQAAPAQ